MGREEGGIVGEGVGLSGRERRRGRNGGGEKEREEGGIVGEGGGRLRGSEGGEERRERDMWEGTREMESGRGRRRES